MSKAPLPLPAANPAVPPPLPAGVAALPYATPYQPQFPPGYFDVGAWQQGNTLVVRDGATLADRCVKCNAPTEGYLLRRQFYWHTPMLYLLLLAGVVVYAIAALCLRQSVVVRMGLCPRHRASRRRGFLAAWGLVLLGLGCFGGSIWLFQSRSTEDLGGMSIVAGIALLLIACVVGILTTRVLRPTRIEHGFGWLEGASPEFVQTLPSSTGY